MSLPSPTPTRLDREIVACRACPRLRAYGDQIARVRHRAFADQAYWGRPVPNLGPDNAPLLIVGLAPAAHGAHRTGRMFTGDRSGDWLFRALHRAGFCNQPTSIDRADGLRLVRCRITAVCHCALPDNRPAPQELRNCRPFLVRTLGSPSVRVVVALGKIAWDASTRVAVEAGWTSLPRPKFSHGATWQVGSRRWIASYHPSQQNTFTGRLTEAMLDDVFRRAAEALGDA